MGWSSGAILAESLWFTVRELLPPAEREAVAQVWIDTFEAEGCDTMVETVLWDDAGLTHSCGVRHIDRDCPGDEDAENEGACDGGACRYGGGS